VKVVILSDLHLGLKAAPTPAALMAALDGANEVILNGDAAESASSAFGHRGEELLSELRARLARAGASVLRIEGNHDPATGELCALRAHGRVLITHGHAFHPAIAPWSAAANDVASEFQRAYQAADDHAEPSRTLLASRAAAISERGFDSAASPLTVLSRMATRPWVFPLVIGYWRMFPELSARFMERAGAAAHTRAEAIPQAIVAGHSHRAGAWLVRGKLILNTGSFTFPGQPHVVTIADENISLTPLTRVAGEWRQDASARRTWVIDEIARSTAPPSTPVS
jgi:predicted phosphodiesterase